MLSVHKGCNALLSLTLHGHQYYSCLLPGKIRLKLPSEISQKYSYIRTSVSVCWWAAGLMYKDCLIGQVAGHCLVHIYRQLHGIYSTYLASIIDVHSWLHKNLRLPLISQVYINSIQTYVFSRLYNVDTDFALLKYKYIYLHNFIYNTAKSETTEYVNVQ